MNFLARSLASMKPSDINIISQIIPKSGTTIAQGLKGGRTVYRQEFWNSFGAENKRRTALLFNQLGPTNQPKSGSTGPGNPGPLLADIQSRDLYNEF